MYTQRAVTPANPNSNQEAFAFVQALALELSSGKVDLPSFPDIAMRVRKVLADDDVTPDKVVRVLGSEPALAARVLQIANSAALNVSGKAITELRSAVARMGFNMVRSAAISFAMSQLKKVDTLKGLETHLDELWQRSSTVAAMSYVVARKVSTKLNPDTAMLAGLLHGVGKLYILTRASKHPALFADTAAYHSIVEDWHCSVAKGLLENWEMSEDVVNAVAEFEDMERTHSGATDLTDILTVACLLVGYRDNPEGLALNMQSVPACKRMNLDQAGYEKLLAESAEEVAALQQALGR
jgi:HD-like signal output (HDOD) protein